MTRTLAIFRKEIGAYLNSPIAYGFMMIFLVYTALEFFIFPQASPTGGILGNFFMQGQASLTAYFSRFALGFGVLVPALCMRLWPEEYKSGTIEILVTLPVRSWEIVVGKFLAMVALIALTLALSAATVVWSVSSLAVGDLDMGPIIGGYIGALLMGSAFCAVGLFTSSFTREQVVGFIGALIVCVVLAVVGTSRIDLMTPDSLQPVGKFIGFSGRFASIEKGVLDIRDAVYFLSVTLIFVFLNVTVLQYRRLK